MFRRGFGDYYGCHVRMGGLCDYSTYSQLHGASGHNVSTVRLTCHEGINATRVRKVFLTGARCLGLLMSSAGVITAVVLVD